MALIGVSSEILRLVHVIGFLKVNALTTTQRQEVNTIVKSASGAPTDEQFASRGSQHG